MLGKKPKICPPRILQINRAITGRDFSKANTAKTLNNPKQRDPNMTTADQQLEGITLNVYLYVAKKGKPVGPRDVMKGANLSSPSVAYRHLQKLEDAGYLAKNEYGEYTVKKKAPLKGSVWLGRSVFPKMWIYALDFLGDFGG